MAKKKDTKKNEEHFMCVEQDGYQAVFHDEKQRKLVAYLLAKVDGYSAMIRTLSKAISLIDK